MTLSSLWSGHPHDLRARRHQARAASAAAARAHARRPRRARRSPPPRPRRPSPIDRVKIIDGAIVVLQSARPRREPHRGHQRRCHHRRRPQAQAYGHRAQPATHPLKFDIKATLPAPPVERQNIPVDFDARCARPVARAAAGQGRGAAQRPGRDDQQPHRHARRRRLQRLGLGRCREQAAGQARPRLPAARRSPSAQTQHRRAARAGLERRADRPDRPELCRRAGAGFRRPQLVIGDGAIRAGRRSMPRLPAAC